MTYIDILATNTVNDVPLTVIRGDMLNVEGAKVLPINEFFNIDDNDWEFAEPRSVLGQFIKRLSDIERGILRQQIDIVLDRRPEDLYTIGYPFGKTIIVNIKEQNILLTNTVKYGINHDNNSRLRFEMEASRHIHNIEGSGHVDYNELTSESIDSYSMLLGEYESGQIAYDTSLLAIELCIESILETSNSKHINKIVVPLLGSGWGALDQKMVFPAIISSFQKALVREKGGLQEIMIVLPWNTSINRQQALRYFRIDISHGICYRCGKRHKNLPILSESRIIEEEIRFIEEQISQYGGDIPQSLSSRIAFLRLGRDRHKEEVENAEHFYKIWKQHERNLHKLLESKARYGMNAPLSLLNEIEYEENEIAKLGKVSETVLGDITSTCKM
jgi:hypothetical protein